MNPGTDAVDVLLVRTLCPTMRPKLAASFRVHDLERAADRNALLAGCAKSIRIVVTTGTTGCDKALIDALPALELIAVASAGYEGVDVAAARARGIALSHAPDATTSAVADLAFGLMIAVARRLADGDRFIRAGRWRDGVLAYGVRVAGKRLGILGLGRVGRAVARRAEAFGMLIHYAAPRPKADVAYRHWTDLVAMAREVDFLVVSCPGGPETRGLIGRTAIEALGPDGILVNVARGSVVDEPTLIEALAAGRLGGAGLDVYADEPRVPEALRALENVVLTPHMASATAPTRAAMTDAALANVRAHLAGRPLPDPIP